MDAAKRIDETRAFRDASISRVEPPLPTLPDPLPKNVTGIACTVLTPEELKITSYDVPELLQVLRDKTFSCEAVTKAFLRRAALAQKLVGPFRFPHKITRSFRIKADGDSRQTALQN
jgi:amidase